jgi:hypothetical protein
MVEACLEFQALTDRYLQILSGDETYRYCTVTDRWAENPDNSFAAACCLEWAARVYPDRAAEYAPLAAKVRAAIAEHLVLPQGRYAHYITANGWRDERPIADIMVRPLLLGYAPATDPLVRGGVEAVWRYNRLPDGTVTTDPAFYQSGQGACFMLHGLAELDSSAASQYFWSFVDAAPATGGWWEYIDNADTTKSGDRMDGSEPLPSALESILHYLFGHKPVPGGLEVAPHLPQGLEWARMENLVVHGRRYDLSTDRRGMVLSRDGQEFLSADQLLRARISGESVELWPIIPTPPYPDLEPAQLSWQEGWHVRPCLGLGDALVNFSLPGLPGRALRYAQSWQGTATRVSLTNLGGQPCLFHVLGETRQLAPQERWDLEVPGPAQGSIAWALLSPFHQRIDIVTPGQSFVLQGRVSREDGAPWRGTLAINWCGQETTLELDRQGCFSVALQAPAHPGTCAFLLRVRGEGAPEARVSLKVSEDPLASLDDIIGDEVPEAAIVAGEDPGAEAAALWLWQEVLNLKQLSLPVCRATLPQGLARNLLLVGGRLPEGTAEPLAEGQGFTIHRSPWNAARYLIHVPPRRDGDVRAMAHGLVQALQLHTRRLARQYREPSPNEVIAIYEFNACNRDWHVARLFGRRPWQSAEVEIEAPGAQTRIGATAATRGALDLGDCTPDEALSAPYVRVLAFSTHPFTTTVAVECDSPEPLPVRVRLTLPLGVRTVWIPDISYYWVTGLSPTCHFDGADEVARLWREADGTEVVEISLRPGEPVRPVLRYPPRGWTPQYPPTFRRMEAVFSYLAPAGLTRG